MDGGKTTPAQDRAESDGQRQTIPVPATRVDFDQRVPMRDGVRLSADVYRPDDDRRYPVILMRTPYLKTGAVYPKNGSFYAERGYVYVVMDVRGRGDSDGEFVPYVNEGRDGYDAVEWCATQPWSDGNVATTGSSYPGCIQWLTALQHPPHLRAMMVAVTPSDPFVETPTGVPSPMHLCWLHLTSGRVTQNMDAVNWNAVYEHLPLLTMDERAGRRNPHWRSNLEHAQLDAYWEPLRYQDKFDQLALPVLHISGWYDDEQIGTPLNFAGMTTQAATPEARKAQRLLMGPWPHQINSTSKFGEVDFGPQGTIDLEGYRVRWLDHHLRGIANGVEAEPPVRIYVMGTNQWRDEREWPLARTQFTPYYLHSAGRANSRFGDGTLASEKPAADETADGYSYDPARPVPFITEPTSSQIGGPDDYSAIERRDDVLVYTTAPLERDTEVTGPVRVTLFASSSAHDTDFMAMLLDVHPTGLAQRLCDGMVRARFRNGMDQPEPIQPGQVYEYQIDCWNTAQVFRAGHRIRLQITSSAFPKYARNLNTYEPMATATTMVQAEQRIYHDAAHPSHVLLPVIP